MKREIKAFLWVLWYNNSAGAESKPADTVLPTQCGGLYGNQSEGTPDDTVAARGQEFFGTVPLTDILLQDRFESMKDMWRKSYGKELL